jgi:hypothetical protein
MEYTDWVRGHDDREDGEDDRYLTAIPGLRYNKNGKPKNQSR